MTAPALILETDENGEPRGIDPRVTVRIRPNPHRSLPAPELRRKAWRANRKCCECNRPIARPADGGLVTLAAPLLLAHKHPCFARAILRHNPTYSAAAARARADMAAAIGGLAL